MTVLWPMQLLLGCVPFCRRVLQQVADSSADNSQYEAALTPPCTRPEMWARQSIPVEHSTRPRRALEAYPAGILAFVRRSSPLDHQPGLARSPAPAVPFVPSTFTLESTRKSMGESGHEAVQPGANVVPAWPYGPQRAG